MMAVLDRLVEMFSVVLRSWFLSQDECCELRLLQMLLCGSSCEGGTSQGNRIAVT